MRAAIVIPAYNEAESIGAVVQDVRAELKKSLFDFGVIVVDDGSTDNTAKKAEAAGAKVIKHILNSGTGSATATGLSYAQRNGYDLVATMDADGQHSPKDVVQGLRLVEKGAQDLLIGSRLIDSRGMSSIKRLGNRGLSLATYFLFGIYATDSQSGLRIFARRALAELSWKTSGYEFCSEMLWRARQLSLSVEEYPIKAIYTNYSQAKGQNNWNAFNILKTLVSRRITELFE